MSTKVNVRPFTATDAAAVAQISRLTGQPDSDSGADPNYLAHLAEAGTILVGSTTDDEVVAWGAVTTTAWGEMLTDLFVDPAWQGRGVGAALLGHLWPAGPVEGHRFTFSSWHARALPLYARAGLVPSWPLLYLRGDPRRLGPSPVHVQRPAPATAGAAEATITGFDRAVTYAYWGHHAHTTGLAVYDGSELVAAGIGSATELTHLACAPDADASASVTAALRALGGTETTICLPGPHPALVPLLDAGFQIIDHDILMACPGVTLPTVWVFSPGLA